MKYQDQVNDNSELSLFKLDNFNGWIPINDTIMGGYSRSECLSSSEGLIIEGDLVEKSGGFVSCRSPLLMPGLNLSKYRGLKIILDGQGLTLKLAVFCKIRFLNLSKYFFNGIHWNACFQTKLQGTSIVEVTFQSLQPVIRAKPVNLPIKFNSSCVTQFQFLHSKFGQDGELNSEFRPGPMKTLIRSISAIR